MEYYDTVDRRLKSFTNQQDVFKNCGADIGKFDCLRKCMLKKKKKISVSSANLTKQQEALDKAQEAYAAIVFLCTLNRDRYQDLLNELVNAYLKGRDDYLKTLVAAHKLVTNWRGEQKPQHNDCTNDGLNFVQKGDKDVHTTKGSHSNKLLRKDGSLVKCHIYGANHYRNSFPKLKEEPTPSTVKKDEEPEANTASVTSSVNANTANVMLGERDWEQVYKKVGLIFYGLRKSLSLSGVPVFCIDGYVKVESVIVLIARRISFDSLQVLPA